MSIDTSKQEPFGWVVRGAKDDDGFTIHDFFNWDKRAAEYAARYYRNGLKREHPGHILPVYIDEIATNEKASS